MSKRYVPETVEALETEYGVWGEVADYPVEDWQYEVANGDTRVGYWTWVFNRIHSELPYKAYIVYCLTAEGRLDSLEYSVQGYDGELMVQFQESAGDLDVHRMEVDLVPGAEFYAEDAYAAVNAKLLRDRLVAICREAGEAGYAVTFWAPEELEEFPGAEPLKMLDVAVQAGNDYLEDFRIES